MDDKLPDCPRGPRDNWLVAVRQGTVYIQTPSLSEHFPKIKEPAKCNSIRSNLSVNMDDFQTQIKSFYLQGSLGTESVSYLVSLARPLAPIQNGLAKQD